MFIHFNFCIHLTSNAHGKIFKIEDIEISEPFDINFNKEKVINKAFSAAFKELALSVLQPRINQKLITQILQILNIWLSHLKLEMKLS